MLASRRRGGIEPRKDFPEFTSAADLRAHYAQVDARISAATKPKPPPQVPKPPPPPPPEPQVPSVLIRKSLMDRIMEETCRYYNISKSSLLSPRRTQEVVIPRQVAMYLARELLRDKSKGDAVELSLPSIGRVFGKRDHTTVLNAINGIERKIVDNPEIAEAVRLIRARFMNGIGIAA